MTVFLAELGDKTQLATVLFAARNAANLGSIFAGAALALILSTAIAVAGGAVLSDVVDTRYLSAAAGLGFILIGLWTLWQAFY